MLQTRFIVEKWECNQENSSLPAANKAHRFVGTGKKFYSTRTTFNSIYTDNFAREKFQEFARVYCYHIRTKSTTNFSPDEFVLRGREMGTTKKKKIQNKAWSNFTRAIPFLFLFACLVIFSIWRIFPLVFYVISRIVRSRLHFFQICYTVYLHSL